jgi:uncharacterized protein
MLELRPICENCARPLPPDSADARICSFECTFCAECVENVLRGVCPNCAGNFVPRPIRPAREWIDGAYLGTCPPSAEPHHKPVDPEAQADLIAAVGDTPPTER